jgi:hypothetical protein
MTYPTETDLIARCLLEVCCCCYPALCVGFRWLISVRAATDYDGLTNQENFKQSPKTHCGYLINLKRKMYCSFQRQTKVYLGATD